MRNFDFGDFIFCFWFLFFFVLLEGTTTTTANLFPSRKVIKSIYFAVMSSHKGIIKIESETTIHWRLFAPLTGFKLSYDPCICEHNFSNCEEGPEKFRT